MSPATKTIRAHVCSATNSTAFPRKLKVAPATLPMITINSTAAFPASLLSASASLSNHFSGLPASWWRAPVPPSPPETPVMMRTIVAMVTEKAVNIEKMVMPCSLNKIQILSARDVSLSRTFSMVCLILATCV